MFPSAIEIWNQSTFLALNADAQSSALAITVARLLANGSVDLAAALLIVAWVRRGRGVRLALLDAGFSALIGLGIAQAIAASWYPPALRDRSWPSISGPCCGSVVSQRSRNSLVRPCRGASCPSCDAVAWGRAAASGDHGGLVAHLSWRPFPARHGGGLRRCPRGRLGGPAGGRPATSSGLSAASVDLRILPAPPWAAPVRLSARFVILASIAQRPIKSGKSVFTAPSNGRSIVAARAAFSADS